MWWAGSERERGENVYHRARRGGKKCLDPCSSSFISLFFLNRLQIKIPLKKCFPFSMGRGQMSTSPVKQAIGRDLHSAWRVGSHVGRTLGSEGLENPWFPTETMTRPSG